MMTPKMVVWGLGIFAGLIVLMNALFVVRENTQVMVLQLGRVQRLIATPGLHVKLPLLQQAVYFDKRILDTDSAPEEVQTLDKKRVVVDSFTRWRIVDSGQFFRTVRNEAVAVQRLNTIVNSNIRGVVASVPLQALVSTSRTEVMGRILKNAGAEARPLGIQIVDVRLKRTDLPPENSEAIFRRMRAERDKEAREIRAQGDEQAQKIRADADRQRTVLLAEAERDAQVMRGEGDSQALRLVGNAAAADPGFYRLTRSMDAYKAALQPSNTMFVLDPSSAFMNELMSPGN